MAMSLSMKMVRLLLSFVFCSSMFYCGYAGDVYSSIINETKFNVSISPNGDLLWEFERGIPQTLQNQIIGKFLTALAVPGKYMVVNLNLGLSDKDAIPTQLMFTSLGKDLMESDLLLKRLAQKEFNSLISQQIIPEDFVEAKYRLWIVPKRLKIVYDKRKNIIRVEDVSLKLRVEAPNRQVSNLLGRYLLPSLERIINSSAKFQKLRQDIGIIGLAWWIKNNLRLSGKYASLINSNFILSMGEELWTVYSYLVNYINNYYAANAEGELGFYEVTSGGIVADPSSAEVITEEEEFKHLPEVVGLNLPKESKDTKSEKKELKDVGKINMSELVPEWQEFSARAHKGTLPETEKDDILYKIGFDGAKARLGWMLPVDRDALNLWLDRVGKVMQDKKAFVFVGMGGSINTIKMMKELFGLDNVLALDNPDRNFIETQLQTLMDNLGVGLSDIEIISISKSATTFETHQISNMLKDLYKQHGLDIYDHIVWLIDLENKGKLAEKGWDIERLSLLPIQPDGNTDIGGRFTCPRTALFLLPAYIIGGKDLILKLMDKVDDIEKDPDFLNMLATFTGEIIGDNYVNPKMAIVLPTELKDAYEPIRIWINQLIQESLGGKVDGFDPKTVVLLKDELNEAVNGILSTLGIISLDFSKLGENSKVQLFSRKGGKDPKLDYLAALTLGLELLTMSIAYNYSLKKGQILNFVNQPNVQLYKEKMKRIERVSPQKVISILDLLSDIEELLSKNKDKDFVEVVYYGPNDDMYNFLKELARLYFRPRRIELVFRGPDWNHHAFQAAPTAKHTVFVVLVDEKADDNVKKVAEATNSVFEENNVASIYRWIGNDSKGGIFKAVLQQLQQAGENKAEVLHKLRKELTKMASKFKNSPILRQELNLALLVMDDIQHGYIYLDDLVITDEEIGLGGFFSEVMKAHGIKEGDLVYNQETNNENNKDNEVVKSPGGIWLKFNESNACLVYSY